MTQATVAEGSATDVTAYLERSLLLFAQARQQLKVQEEKVHRMQGELIDLLDSSHGGSLRVTDGNFSKIFTVVRPIDEVEHYDEEVVKEIAKRYTLQKRLTKTVVNWDAVRALIDSGVFPDLAPAISTEEKPKRPYIKIS